ncbi:MAG: hypothetical protein AAFP99_11960 [Pseudomonadota bacterium]
MESILDWGQQYPNVLRAIGVTGFCFYITSFFGVQRGLICGNSMLYSILTVSAATCVLISLIGEFNLASLLINVSFVSCGVFGIYRRLTNKAAQPNQQGAETKMVPAE